MPFWAILITRRKIIICNQYLQLRIFNCEWHFSITNHNFELQKIIRNDNFSSRMDVPRCVASESWSNLTQIHNHICNHLKYRNDIRWILLFHWDQNQGMMRSCVPNMLVQIPMHVLYFILDFKRIIFNKCVNFHHWHNVILNCLWSMFVFPLSYKQFKTSYTIQNFWIFVIPLG
jgi:hypothetical protein